MNADQEKRDNKIVEKYEELDDAVIEFLVDDQKKRIKRTQNEEKLD